MIDVRRELCDRLIDRPGRVRLEQRLEAPCPVPFALEPQHGFRDARAPRLDRPADRDRDVAQEGPELITRATPARSRRGRGRRTCGGPRRASDPSNARTSSGASAASFTAWCAMSRLRTPRSSRTLWNSFDAAASSTPDWNVAPRSSRLPPEDGDPCLVVGRTDVHDEPAREARDQTLVQIGDLRRRPVARQHDLVPRGLQGLGESEQLGLHLAAVGEKLHVVHEQQIDVLKPATERVALARRHGGVKRLDVLVERQVFDREVGQELLRRLPDGHEEVGLAEP